MATLGKTTGTTTTNWLTPYVEVAGPYTALENGTINSVKIKVAGGGIGDTAFRAVVYLNSGGNPGALVATSAEVTVLSAQAAGEVTCTISSGSIVSGSGYWIGFEHANSGAATTMFYKDTGSSGASQYVSNGAYPTAPNPFGTGTAFTDQLWAYIDYTPSGASNKGSFFALMAMAVLL